MNVVFISPHFPPQYYHFCLELRRAGCNVLGLGDERYEALSPELKDALTEYYWIEDMSNYDNLVRACGYFTHKYGKLDRIDSLNEFWLSTEAKLRDDFNLFGIRGDKIGYIRQKSMMKEVFKKAKIPVAVGEVVATLADAKKLLKQTGYPVVIKPNSGVGALDTCKIHNDKEMSDFFARKPDGTDYIMESFIVGDIVSFDGLTDRDGNIVFNLSSYYSQGVMETVNGANHIYYNNLVEIPKKLLEVGKRAVKAFEVKERFFHFEFFRTKDGNYTALEVNMRPPGGYTTDMFNYACDTDVYKMWAQAITGQKVDSFKAKYFCCYASRKERLAYAHSHDEVMAKIGDKLCKFVNVPGVFASALGESGYIFRTKDNAELEQIAEFIHKLK